MGVSDDIISEIYLIVLGIFIVTVAVVVLLKVTGDITATIRGIFESTVNTVFKTF